MEPLTLKCGQCATEWKLFKAPAGPILCPSCQQPVEPPPGFVHTPAEPPPLPPPPVVITSAPTTPPTLPEPLPPPPRPFREPFEHDAEERDYAEPEVAYPPQTRRAMHPLMSVIIVLLVLFVLLPTALVVGLFALCAFA